MEQTVEEFFHDFRQETLADAEANSTYQLEAFMEVVSSELIETGFTDGFEHCHFRALRGMRVDGYWFNDEGAIDIFIADFDCRPALETLTRTEVDATFKRAINFFDASFRGSLEPDITTPEYGLIRSILDRKSLLLQVNFFLVSERILSDRFQGYPDGIVCGIPATYHIWDMARFQRQRSSRGHKEPLDIDFVELSGNGIPCLPANLGSDSYQSYLIVMPATVLAALYERYGARLLEQNVRTFLQARAQVNKGIRETIIKEPQMFFAFNNGITATAQEVLIRTINGVLYIVRMIDLQIVNGGQTTASLFHTKRRDKADLSEIFVQMKLSVVDSEQSEKIVPRISEFANTQNRVTAADFFSNHPYHVRMADFSRRMWAPAQKGAQRETKWFYERVRGQYIDAQSKLTRGEQKRFLAENPKSQMFTKTDLAKFENVFDDHPRWVNLGSQRNFARYALRIGKEWEKSSTVFNEQYFRRIVARAIIFRYTEQLVKRQSWFLGGYRANIVTYAIAAIGEVSRRCGGELHWQRIWQSQEVFPSLDASFVLATKFVNDYIMTPPSGISNISEWSKKESCWDKICDGLDQLTDSLPHQFVDDLVSFSDAIVEQKKGRKLQVEDDKIQSQAYVCKIPASTWRLVLEEGQLRKLFGPKEVGCLQVAQQLPNRVPTPKQCLVIIAALERLKSDGFTLPN